MSKKECELPFWRDYSVVLNHFTLQYTPQCEHSKWNFLFRLLLVSIFVGMIASVLGGLSAFLVTLLFGGITAFAIIMITPYNEKRWDTYHTLPYVANVNPSADPSAYIAPIKEHFVNGGSRQGSTQPSGPTGFVEVDAFPYSGPALPDYTPPTSRNLFMNVLLDEIKYNPGRPEAAPVDNPTVKQTMDDYFRVQWFSDPTDVFGKNQSQRQFVTQPSTRVHSQAGCIAFLARPARRADARHAWRARTVAPFLG